VSDQGPLFDRNSDAVNFPPFETEDLRENLTRFLDTPFNWPGGPAMPVGNFRWGVLASPHETRVVALEFSRSRFVQLSVRRGANLVVTLVGIVGDEPGNLSVVGARSLRVRGEKRRYRPKGIALQKHVVGVDVGHSLERFRSRGGVVPAAGRIVDERLRIEFFADAMSFITRSEGIDNQHGKTLGKKMVDHTLFERELW
jgi:hypothetical protein